MHEHDPTAAERKALGRRREAADIAAEAQHYGPVFLRAYNRARPYASHHVAFAAALLECKQQPHELERHARECERYARAHGIAWDRRLVYAANGDLRRRARARGCESRQRPTTRRVAVRPHVRRRAGSSSATSSADPGSGASDPEPAGPSPHTGRQHHTAGLAR